MPYIIAVAGSSGSGKSTVAQHIFEHFGPENCEIISSDHYYKGLRDIPIEAWSEYNFDHPNSIDFDLLETHLRSLKNGLEIDRPNYDFLLSQRVQHTTRIGQKRVFIVEGILVLTPENMRSIFDKTIFVKATPDVCFQRRLERDVKERGRSLEEVRCQYEKHVKPMDIEFVQPCERLADLVLENNEEIERHAFDMKEVISALTIEVPNRQPSDGPQRFRLFAKKPEIPQSQHATLSLTLV